MAEIKDSGNRTEFESGAVRDIQEGKGRCDLLPLNELGVLFETIAYTKNSLHNDPKENKVAYILYCLNNYQNWSNINERVKCLYKSILMFSLHIKEMSLCELVLELACHFEDGAKKYGDRNWEKGIPTDRYIDSGIRHLMKHLRGDIDERHDRAFVWNMICCAWTTINRPECDSYRKD